MRIALILTGGTICCRTAEDGARRSDANSALSVLEQRYRLANPYSSVEFETQIPLNRQPSGMQYITTQNFVAPDPASLIPSPGARPTAMTLRLVLKNNIIMRSIRQGDRAMNSFGQDVWDSLDNAEKMIVSYLINKGRSDFIKLFSKFVIIL